MGSRHIKNACVNLPIDKKRKKEYFTALNWYCLLGHHWVPSVVLERLQFYKLACTMDSAFKQ